MEGLKLPLEKVQMHKIKTHPGKSLRLKDKKAVLWTSRWRKTNHLKKVKIRLTLN